MIKTILLYIVFGYLGLMAFAFLFSSHMIFLAPKPTYKDSESVIKLTTQSGSRITAIYLPNQKAKFTLLVSHGNATDLGGMMPLLQLFHNQGFSVFAYDYSGYGTSTGRASEKQSYQDMNAAYNYLTTELKTPPQKIIAYGHSLGAALSIDLASRKPIAGLILHSPFLSAFRVRTFITILPFDKFNNVNKIKKIHCPVLMIHGTRDFVIPFYHSKNLYKMIPTKKHHLWVKDAGHNNLFSKAGERYWQAIKNFAATLNDE